MTNWEQRLIEQIRYVVFEKVMKSKGQVATFRKCFLQRVTALLISIPWTLQPGRVGMSHCRTILFTRRISIKMKPTCDLATYMYLFSTRVVVSFAHLGGPATCTFVNACKGWNVCKCSTCTCNTMYIKLGAYFVFMASLINHGLLPCKSYLVKTWLSEPWLKTTAHDVCAQVLFLSRYIWQ